MHNYDEIVGYFISNFLESEEELVNDVAIGNYGSKLNHWFGCYFGIPVKKVPPRLLKDILEQKMVGLNPTPTSVEVINKMLILGFTTIDCNAYKHFTEQQATEKLINMKEKFNQLIEVVYNDRDCSKN